ncbi:membrane protein implicated in regulation of membrane protease activity [Neobacillus niacini]|uniref:hypothetical protein n=1 Tax=Neobacillus niacini TaxID=86668 RepID=UPI0028591230|nr:hypothetical protein [Neobacillus niacini]MDR7077912.1 membrane protein implicated in regulation of membrane protease activity [Neobacillus niacini]
MLTVIWVLGTMLLMLLIHFLLPLGYTTKGKIVVVVSSGLLALGGLASTAAFPVGQTLIMLLVLSFFVSYIMDSRLGKVIYKTKEQFIEEDDIEGSESTSINTIKTEKTSDIELMDLSELEISTSSSVNKLEVDPLSVDSLDEDISFLQDREIESDNEEILDDAELEVGYLSDIESLLEESPEEKKVELQVGKVESLDEESWLDELAELTVIKDEEKDTFEETQFEDFELDELFADKEVAATSDNDESKPKKVLELQK